MHQSSAADSQPSPSRSSISNRSASSSSSNAGESLPEPAQDSWSVGIDRGVEEFPEAEPESGIRATRDQRRSRRKRSVRSRSVAASLLVVTDADSHFEVNLDTLRPTQRGQCADVPRPCPFVSCRYHLYLDVSPRTGSIKFNFPDLEVEEMRNSCALDLAEQGALTAEQLGETMNVTRERVRQLEHRGLKNALRYFDSGE